MNKPEATNPGTTNPGTTKNQFILFVTLLMFWLLLNSSVALDTFAIGVLVSVVITLLFKDGLSFFTEFNFNEKAILSGISYYTYFFTELIKSNLKLASIVVTPSLPINPGIIRVKTCLTSKMGRLMLANSITMTPGTLTVDVKDEWLYIHCVDVGSSELEAATQEIVFGFEKHLKVMYG